MDRLPRSSVREAEAALGALPATVAAAGDSLPLVIAAWSRVDPELAARLLEAWGATADAQGNLAPFCPMVCQLAGWIADGLPDPDPYIQRILPALARCIEGEFEHFDVKGTGLPLWRSAEEALFPSEFSPGRFTVDLAVLLSNEAAAFVRLAEGHPDVAKAVDQAEGEQRDLDGWLQDQFWNEEQSLFYRYEAEGESVPDVSPCGYIPLVWEGRTPEMTEGVRPRSQLLSPALWPLQTWILFFALLLRTPHHRVRAQMRDHGLPEGASETEAAIWGVLVAESARLQAQSRGEISGPLRWLDGHGQSAARVALVCGVILFIGLLGWLVFHREDVRPDSLADLERRARQASAQGRHGRAAALYGQAARQGRSTYFRYLQAGEWILLNEPAEAEAAYRDLLAREPDAPNVRLNLALSIWRQDRREEALALYRAFVEENGGYPELAARAQLAVALIEQQLALDRGKTSENESFKVKNEE